MKAFYMRITGTLHRRAQYFQPGAGTSVAAGSDLSDSEKPSS